MSLAAARGSSADASSTPRKFVDPASGKRPRGVRTKQLPGGIDVLEPDDGAAAITAFVGAQLLLAQKCVGSASGNLCPIDTWEPTSTTLAISLLAAAAWLFWSARTSGGAAVTLRAHIATHRRSRPQIER